MSIYPFQGGIENWFLRLSQDIVTLLGFSESIKECFGFKVTNENLGRGSAIKITCCSEPHGQLIQNCSSSSGVPNTFSFLECISAHTHMQANSDTWNKISESLKKYVTRLSLNTVNTGTTKKTNDCPLYNLSRAHREGRPTDIHCTIHKCWRKHNSSIVETCMKKMEFNFSCANYVEELGGGSWEHPGILTWFGQCPSRYDSWPTPPVAGQSTWN